MALSLTSSKVTNFKFIKASLTQNNVPDYNGYCTAEARISGKPLLPETKILYQPYIDESPTDPSTILTAMEDAEQIAKDAGQKYTVFTADQQLYAIVLNIVSCNPKRWEYFIPRLGGMHWQLRSYLKNCIHPLDTDCHTENQLCNIVTGQIAEKNVNVNKANLLVFCHLL